VNFKKLYIVSIAVVSCVSAAIGELSDPGSYRDRTIHRGRLSVAPPHAVDNTQCLRHYPWLLGVRHAGGRHAVGRLERRRRC